MMGMGLEAACISRIYKLFYVFYLALLRTDKQSQIFYDTEITLICTINDGPSGSLLRFIYMYSYQHVSLNIYKNNANISFV